EPRRSAAGGEAGDEVRHRPADPAPATDDRAGHRDTAQGDAAGPPRGLDEAAPRQAGSACTCITTGPCISNQEIANYRPPLIPSIPQDERDQTPDRFEGTIEVSACGRPPAG